jgi:hypothetical protein
MEDTHGARLVEAELLQGRRQRRVVRLRCRHLARCPPPNRSPRARSKEDSKDGEERNGGEGVRWEGRTCRNPTVVAYLGKCVIVGERRTEWARLDRDPNLVGRTENNRVLYFAFLLWAGPLTFVCCC